MKPAPRLGSSFEVLEDRTVPATWGVAWPDPGHLTLSFVPDGTQTPVGPSALDQVLTKAAGSVAAGEAIILRAFQTWASAANINIGVVADGGEPLGTPGAVEGDPRFGDIRISAASLSPDSVANSSPFSFAGTTLDGDVVLNSNLPFGVGNSGSAYDLYSVAIHEAGHVFGFPDIPGSGSNSVMYQNYSYRTGLSSGDIGVLQALYGAPQADTYSHNNTIFNAAALPQTSNGELLATAGLTTPSSVEYFKFNTPLLTTTLSGITVRLKAEGLSLLTAKVTVYNAAGQQITATQSTDPLNNDLTLSFEPNLFSALLGGTYYVKVQGVNGSAFDTGSYKLAVDFLSLNSILAPITTGLLGGVLGLQTNSSGHDARFDDLARGVLTNSQQVDSYHISTNKYAAGTSVTLNVMVWGLDANPLDPAVRVFDANGNPVAFQVLANQDGLFSVQVLNAVAGSTYDVQVFARPGAGQSTGNYFFAADFDQVPYMVFDNVAGGTVGAGNTTTADTMTLSQAGVYQFALGASSAGVGGTVTMNIYDQYGNLVFSLTAVAGQPPVTATEYLLAGNYTVTYSGAMANTGPVSYGLFMDELTDLSGPYLTSTASPSSSTAPSSTQSTSSSSSSSSSSSTSAPSYSYSGSSTYQPTGYYYTY